MLFPFAPSASAVAEQRQETAAGGDDGGVKGGGQEGEKERTRPEREAQAISVLFLEARYSASPPTRGALGRPTSLAQAGRSGSGPTKHLDRGRVVEYENQRKSPSPKPVDGGSDGHRGLADSGSAPVASWTGLDYISSKLAISAFRCLACLPFAQRDTAWTLYAAIERVGINIEPQPDERAGGDGRVEQRARLPCRRWTVNNAGGARDPVTRLVCPVVVGPPIRSPKNILHTLMQIPRIGLRQVFFTGFGFGLNPKSQT